MLSTFKRVVMFLTIASFSFSGAVFAQKKKDELTFEAEDVTKIKKSKKMERAERFYKKALSPTSTNPLVYFQSATIYFKQVVAKDNPDDSPEIKQKAQFYMGKCLYHMGYHSASKNYFEKVVNQGESHPFYTFFRQIPSGSIYFMKGKIFQGITLVRFGRPVKAIKSFNAIIKFAKKNPNFKNILEYVELANLSLARVYYQAGRVAVGRFGQTKKKKFAKLAEKYLRLSITFYEKVQTKSFNWPQTLFEESWAYFILDAMLRPVFKKDYGGYQKALGNIHTLNAPFFENFFFPESLILRGVIYFNNCRVKRAQESLDEFGNKYPPLQKGVRSVADKYRDGEDEDNDSYYNYVLKIKNEKAGLSPELSRLVKSALNDRTFERKLEFITELKREIKQLKASDKSWQTSDIAREIREGLEFQKSMAQAQAGKAGRMRIRRLDDYLTKMVLQFGDVKIEIDNLRLKKVSSKALNKSPKVKVRGVTVDDEHVIWPFTGAYWKDELGYYRFVVRSSCGTGK